MSLRRKPNEHQSHKFFQNGPSIIKASARNLSNDCHSSRLHSPILKRKSMRVRKESPGLNHTVKMAHRTRTSISYSQRQSFFHTNKSSTQKTTLASHCPHFKIHFSPNAKSKMLIMDEKGLCRLIGAKHTGKNPPLILKRCQAQL